MKKIRVFFDRPNEYKFRLDNFVVTDYSEPLLLFKANETFRIVLFVGIIFRKTSKRFCLGYFNEHNHYDYLSVSMEEKNAYENLKNALNFISTNFKIIKTVDLKYAYLWSKGEVVFRNGVFDVNTLGNKDTKILMKDSKPKKLSLVGKVYRAFLRSKYWK